MDGLLHTASFKTKVQKISGKERLFERTGDIISGLQTIPVTPLTLGIQILDREGKTRDKPPICCSMLPQLLCIGLLWHISWFESLVSYPMDSISFIHMQSVCKTARSVGCRALIHPVEAWHIVHWTCICQEFEMDFTSLMA